MKKTETAFTLDVIHSEIVEEVRKDLLKREKKGFEEYGTNMDRSDLSLLEWMQHSYEEKLDDLVYMKKIITTLKSKNK